jgi:cysteine synthase
VYGKNVLDSEIMAKIAKNLTELIGHTPLMELAEYSCKYGLKRNIVAKLESFNPAGSVKDRVAFAMIEDAEARGALKPGATIIEPTSGNTGVGLAMVATIKGYHLILTMPETMSVERRNLLKALGAEIVLTDGLTGMAGSIAKAKELRDAIPGAVILQQFENPSNAKAHEHTTGEEIWTDTDGKVTVFVAGVGTGGTVCGVARALKKHNPDVYVVAVEPASSPVLEGGEDAPHRIQGIGANFIPSIYDASVVDEIIPVPDDEAIRGGRELASTEGLLAGISSGAAVYAARLLAERPEFADAKEIGTIHQFRTKGRLMEQTFEGLHGTDVGKQSQFLAHSQQALLGTHFGSRVIVEFRVTYGREQYSIRIFTSLISGFGKRVTHLVYRVCTADGIFIVHFMSELLTHGSHHIHAYGRDFGADTVTGQHCNFKIHCFLYYLKVHLSSFCLQDSCGDTGHPTQNQLSI